MAKWISSDQSLKRRGENEMGLTINPQTGSGSLTPQTSTPVGTQTSTNTPIKSNTGGAQTQPVAPPDSGSQTVNDQGNPISSGGSQSTTPSSPPDSGGQTSYTAQPTDEQKQAISQYKGQVAHRIDREITSLESLRDRMTRETHSLGQHFVWSMTGIQRATQPGPLYHEDLTGRTRVPRGRRHRARRDLFEDLLPRRHELRSVHMTFMDFGDLLFEAPRTHGRNRGGKHGHVDLFGDVVMLDMFGDMEPPRHRRSRRRDNMI